MAVITKKTALLGIAVVAGLLALWKFVWRPTQSDEKMNAQNSNAQIMKDASAPVVAAPRNSAATPTNSTIPAKTAMVKTHYNNPGGGDDVAFTLSVDDKGVITEAKTDVLAINPTSKMRQQSFAEALPAAIVGKDIHTLSSIDRVGGSSLTTGAFNAALDQLKAQL